MSHEIFKKSQGGKYNDRMGNTERKTRKTENTSLSVWASNE